jgi:hypothetical protein
MKFNPVTLTAEDQQLIESKHATIEDIARWIGVPVHLLASITKETSFASGLETQLLGFITFTLLGWAKRWEQAITRDLLSIEERRTYYAEHTFAGFARGDLKTRYEAYSVGRNGGWLSANDIRRLEGMNSIDGGDVYLRPVNMVDANAPDPVLPPAAPAPSLPAALSPARAHHELMIHDAAARIVRKEIAHLSAAAKRCAGDQAAWMVALMDFETDHRGYVAETLRIPLSAASAYVTERMASLTKGATALEDGEIEAVTSLVALVSHQPQAA